MAGIKNMKMQMNKIIDGKIAIGSSKVKFRNAQREKVKREDGYVKKGYVNKCESPMIHSCSTADAYRKVVGEFSGWLKESQREIWDSKDLSHVEKDTCYQYLHEREENGCSPYTVSANMSALNKVLGLNLSKDEGNLAERDCNNITRSRLETKSDSEYNPNNYKDQIQFSQSFGLRRESVFGGKYSVKESSLFKEDGRLYCGVISKGGRYNEQPCIAAKQEAMENKYTHIEERHSSPFTILNLEKRNADIESREKYDLKIEQTSTKAEFIANYNKTDDSYKLFHEYTKVIDNHAFRRDYAQELYRELAQDKIDNGDITYHDCYKIFDREIVMKVSNALGHNRINVAIENYLRN